MPLTRKILADLGLPKEHIDAIMSSRDDILAGYISQTDADKAVATAVAAAKAEPGDITKHPDYLKLQTSIADKDKAILAAKQDAAVQIALASAKTRNPKAAMALLDSSKFELQADGTVKGLKEAIEGLQKSDGYLFGEGSPAPTQPGFNPIPAGADPAALNAQIEAARAAGNMPLMASLIRQAGTPKT